MEALPRAINLCKFQSPTSRTVVTQPRVNASRPLFRVSGHSSFHDSLLRVRFSCCPRDLRSRPVAKASDHDHDHHHHHDDDDPHHHRSHHDHRHRHHHGGDPKLTGPQRALGEFARAIGWVDLANLLRENLQMCCCSAALFLAAAACPYLIPKPVVKPFQNSLMLLAFPLVGVSASLDALTDIAAGRVNIHVLMALAAFASTFMGNPLEGGLLLAMFNLAHIAEEYFTSRSMIDVRELKENYPDFALVLDVDDEESPKFADLAYRRVPVYDVAVGSYILVGAGESVPVDCEVLQGSATITIEHLTGEVKPLEAKCGDRIPGGARNLDGRIVVKATKTWKESTLSKIVQLTEEAQLNKPKLQRWLDEFGEHYSKVVVVLSVAVAIIGPLLFKWPFFSTSDCRGSIYRALGLMVAASPCALAVAPLAYATAISSCARKGILLKGGHVLDALASCHTVAFDKTGTLTTGGLMFKAVEPIYGHEKREDESKIVSCCNPSCEEEALAVAAAMEKGTTHPIGRLTSSEVPIGSSTNKKKVPIGSKEQDSCKVSGVASADWGTSFIAEFEKVKTIKRISFGQDVRILVRAVVDHCVGKDLPSISVERFEYFPGRGLNATLNNTEAGSGGGKSLKASLGSIDFITSFVKAEDESRKIKEAVGASSYGRDLVHAALSVNKKITLIHLEDRPRQGVAEVVAALKGEANLRVIMLTGDHESSAWRVANSVGIGEVYCGLKPEDKLSYVKSIPRDTGGGLIMVGEGINDAPALAAATVGIVLAQRASATAVAVADVLLLRDNISGVPFSIAKSRHTTSLVKQNVALALSCIFLASLPSVFGLLPLWLTVLLHEGGTLLVCLNSIRALNDPTWSWRQDLSHLLGELKGRFGTWLKSNLDSTIIEATHL